MEIINQPELQVYVEGFGSRNGDICLVAESDEVIVGAVWVRIMNDYGHVDDDTPSLAVQKQNYAVRMYKNVGFEIVDENKEEYIMVCRLCSLHLKNTYARKIFTVIINGYGRIY